MSYLDQAITFGAKAMYSNLKDEAPWDEADEDVKELVVEDFSAGLTAAYPYIMLAMADNIDEEADKLRGAPYGSGKTDCHTLRVHAEFIRMAAAKILEKGTD